MTVDVVDIQALLTIIQRLEQSDHQSLALDVLYDEFDTELIKENYDYCDGILVEVQDIMTQFSPTLHIGFLTISYAAKKHLSARSAYYHRVREHFQSLFPAQRVKRLLQGLD